MGSGRGLSMRSEGEGGRRCMRNRYGTVWGMSTI